MAKVKIEVELDVDAGMKPVYNPETRKIEIVPDRSEPNTWKEFCDISGNTGWYIKEDCDIAETLIVGEIYKSSKNLCDSREEAEAFLAFMQLRRLRNCYVEGWKPEWWDDLKEKYIIRLINNDLVVQCTNTYASPMSFPNKEMAEKFVKNFKNLLTKVKVLFQ